MYPITNGSIPPRMNSSVLAGQGSIPALPSSQQEASISAEETGEVPSHVSELRQAYPWLNASQLGNLMLNQSGQKSSYHQVQALRPSYQTDYFRRH